MLALLLVFALLLWRFVYKLRYRYIGYGWVFDWKDGEVFVLTRLLKSPSGRAEVQLGARILEYNGEPMVFDSREDFLAIYKTLRAKKVGQKVSVKIRESFSRGEFQERTITMEAEVIWGPIPYYGNWSSEEMSSMQTQGHFVPRECNKTGAYYTVFFHNRY